MYQRPSFLSGPAWRGRAILLLMLLACSWQVSNAQSSPKTGPRSFSSAGLSAAANLDVNSLDNTTLIAAADAAQSEAAAKGDVIPFQVAEPIPVRINVLTRATIDELPNGTLYRLRIASPKATAIHLIFDRWILPGGAELYVYDDAGKQVNGPYTSLDNWVDTTNVTPPIVGDAVTLEYFVPDGVTDAGELSISTVLHHFRGGDHNPLDAYGDSDNCVPTINCPEGATLQFLKRSVAKLFLPGGGVCSGTLINDLANSSIPYFLSANHCYPSGDMHSFVVRFDWESVGCPRTPDSTYYDVSNAFVVARWDNSDFLLLRLSTPPPAEYIPFYAGWNRSVNQPSAPVWGIHHPRGDIKRMLKDNDAPVSTDWNGEFSGNYWFVDEEIGGTEPGSSGSALFDADGKVVGQLRGGPDELSPCDPDNWSKYGKFSDSWYGGGLPENSLRFWLDPFETGWTLCNSFVPPAAANGSCTDSRDVTYFPFYDSGYTWWATNELPDCNVTRPQQAWYHLQAQECKKLITVSTCGSLLDGQIVVTSYGCWDELFYVPIACAEDGAGNCPDSWIYSTQQAQLTFQLPSISETGGSPNFYVGIMGEEGQAQAGLYQVQITAQDVVATNDQCPGLNITTLPYTWTGNTNCATNNYSPSCASDGGAPDVVWRFYAPCDGTFIFSTCGSSFNTVLELKQASAPYTCSAPMTILDCNNNDFTCANGLNSKVVATLTQGTICYLYLDGVNGASGDYVLNVEQIGQNVETCPGRPINSLPYQDIVNNQCMSDDYIASCGGQWGYDGVYVYTPTQPCRDIEISSRFSIPTIISVRTGGACPGDTELSCHVFDGGTNSRFTMQASEGVTYYIMVDTEIGTYGTYNLEVVDMGPSGAPNDVCFGAPVITTLPYTDSGDTRCATYDFFHCGGGNAPDVLYIVNLPCTRFVTARLCGSDYDTRLDVRTGEGCAGTTLIDCNDDDFCEGVPSLTSGVSWGATANTEYYLLVHGYQGAAGHYELTIVADSCLDVAPPPVDDMVVTSNLTTGDVTLAWSSVPNADTYDVYRSQVYETLYDTGNVIATVIAPTFTCTGCMNDPMNPSFFGVRAVNAPVILQSIDPMTRESK